MEKSQKIFLAVLVVLIVALGVTAIVRGGGGAKEPQSGVYDQFATCLADRGATFYGAFWCPHCKEQKKMFGSSQQYLNYVECSTPDGQGTTQICKDKNVTGYPTWDFADGTRENGTLSLEALATKTACVLPVVE